MNCIILAAGEGKRLHPLTNLKPKCMVDLFGKPILQHQLSIMQRCGINDITIVTGYKSELIKYPNIHYIQNKNFGNTNMVESLFCALEKFSESTIVSYGDIIFEEKILKKLINSNHDFSIIIDKKWEDYWKIRTTNPLNDLESLKLDDEENILSIGQEIKTLNELQGQYIGLMKFQNDAIKKIKSFYLECKEIYQKTNSNPLNNKIPFEKSYLTDFLQGLVNSGNKLKAVNIENGWLEVDTINDHETYEKLFKSGELKKFFSL